MDTSKTFIKMCDCPEIQSKWAILMDEKAHPTTDAHDYSTYIVKENRKMECIWLPRQDQIQEMVEQFMVEIKNWRGAWTLQQYFHHWFLEKAKINVNTTLEQLWLAFYMYRKHSKIWDGEKWLKKL